MRPGLYRFAALAVFWRVFPVGVRSAIVAGPEVLGRLDAERIALANNPRIRISELLQKVQGQAVRETRAGELPSLAGNVTGVEANEASRVDSGALTASRLLTRAGTGVQFSQLITDFGPTFNLVASEKLKEKASQADVAASREDIVLATDQVFFQALEVQSTLQIADQTVVTRQMLVDKITVLANEKLKSTLDLSFAQVTFHVLNCCSWTLAITSTPPKRH